MIKNRLKEFGESSGIEMVPRKFVFSSEVLWSVFPAAQPDLGSYSLPFNSSSLSWIITAGLK